MEMTTSLADTCAKLLPALGTAAVVELRFIRKRVAQLRNRHPHKELPRTGFRVATTVWFVIIAWLVYYELRCLLWLSVPNNPDHDSRLASNLVWLIGSMLVLLIIPAALINAKAAATGDLSEEYN